MCVTAVWSPAQCLPRREDKKRSRRTCFVPSSTGSPPMSCGVWSCRRPSTQAGRPAWLQAGQHWICSRSRPATAGSWKGPRTAAPVRYARIARHGDRAGQHRSARCHLDVGRLHHLLHLLFLAAQEGVEEFRRVLARELLPEDFQPLAQFRVLLGFLRRVGQGLSDCRRYLCRRHQPEKELVGRFLVAEFGKGRDVGKCRGPDFGSDGECTQLARLDELGDRGSCAHHERHPTRHHIGDGQRDPLVGNQLHPDACALCKQFDGQVRSCANAYRPEGDGIGRLLCRGDELLERLERRVVADHERHGHLGEVGNADEVAGDEACVLVYVGQGDDRVGRHDQRVAVRRRLQHIAYAQQGAGARQVFADDRLLQDLGHALTVGPGHRVADTTRRRRYDKTDGLDGKGLISPHGRAQSRSQQQGGRYLEDQSASLHKCLLFEWWTFNGKAGAGGSAVWQEWASCWMSPASFQQPKHRSHGLAVAQCMDGSNEFVGIDTGLAVVQAVDELVAQLRGAHAFARAAGDVMRGQFDMLAIGQLDVEEHGHHAEEGHGVIGHDRDLPGCKRAHARVAYRLLREVADAHGTTLQAHGHGVGDAELCVDHASRLAVVQAAHHVHCLPADPDAHVLDVLRPQAAAVQFQRQVDGGMREAARRIGFQAQVVDQCALRQAGVHGVEVELAVLVQVDEPGLAFKDVLRAVVLFLLL